MASADAERVRTATAADVSLDLGALRTIRVWVASVFIRTGILILREWRAMQLGEGWLIIGGCFGSLSDELALADHVFLSANKQVTPDRIQFTRGVGELIP